jgi:hypothetical protein
MASRSTCLPHDARVPEKAPGIFEDAGFEQFRPQTEMLASAFPPQDGDCSMSD